MTKKELWKNAKQLLDEHGASQELVDALTPLLKPQRSGGPIDVASVTLSDEDGNITHIECSLSGVYLPATEDYFYAEKDETKGINGLKRVSKQADKIAKEHKKQVDVSVRAITEDVFSGNIGYEVGAEKIKELRASKPDFGSVSE